ncbi:hypothetical protein J2T13_001428 [Paenibacillus sp. DS2015]|uniref:hypothetical protein n=1 Tax=Paenibacillus sp. DS2015 TaxID=3373917 RepID=UPI003D24AEFA
MKQRVEPDKIRELSGGMERLNRIMNDTSQMYAEMNKLIKDIPTQYPESGYVQSATREVDDLLREIRNLTLSLHERLDGKASTLKKTAGQYEENEEKLKLILSKSPSISWVNMGTKWDGKVAVKSYSIDRWQLFFLEFQKNSLEKSLKPYQGEPQIAILLELLKTGTIVEQRQAVEQLSQISRAFDGIERSQVAYSIYSKYENRTYMDEVQQQAEQYRLELKALGISDEWYNADVNLTLNYSRPPLTACDFDPLQQDGTPMPTVLWGIEDHQLTSDKQIVILLLTDQYFQATTKEQREEIIRTANGIRDGTLSAYQIIGNKTDESTVSSIMQSLVNNKKVLEEMMGSIEHDSKLSVFANMNLSYHTEAVNQAMKVLNQDLQSAENSFWNSDTFTDPNWWKDENKLAIVAQAIAREALLNGSMSLPEVQSGNKMAAIQYLTGALPTKEWDGPTYDRIQAIMTRYSVEGNPTVLTPEVLGAIIDRYNQELNAPSIKWGQVGLGVVQAIGGGFETFFGVTLGIATSETVVGGLLGAYVATHGSSNVTGGISRIWNGFNGSDAGDTANFEKNMFEGVGGEVGVQLYNGIDLAVAFAQPADLITKMIYKSPTAAIDVYKAGIAVDATRSTVTTTSKTTIEGTGDLKYTYNMVENPGPLAEINPGAGATFRSGMYNIEILQQDTILYRVGKAGGEKNALGQYFTWNPITRIEGRIDMAIKPQWIDPNTGKLTGSSPLDSVYAIKIPQGTTIYEGPAANQGSIYTGGGNQIFISEPWKIKGVQPISETPLK